MKVKGEGEVNLQTLNYLNYLNYLNHFNPSTTSTSQLPQPLNYLNFFFNPHPHFTSFCTSGFFNGME